MVRTVDDASGAIFLGFMTIETRSTGGGYTAEGAPVYDRFNSLHWRVGRDSCLYGVNFPSTWINRPTNPHSVVKITGNGGGRFFFVTSEGAFNRSHSDYRLVDIQGTREPLWFYGLNGEATKSFQLWGDPCDTNVEIVDSENISIIGLKREGISPGVIIKDSRNIALYASGAMRWELFSGSGGYLQVRGNSSDVLMAGILVQEVGFGHTQSGPILLEALSTGETNQVLWPEGVSIYKRGTFNDFAVSLAIDADEDGIPSEWENIHGLDALDPQDAFLNADGDTLINADEYIAGTDPQDAASNFSAILPASGTGVAFESTLGRLYSVEGKVDLLESSWSLLTQDWPGTGGVMEYDDALGTNQFYRIRVTLP